MESKDDFELTEVKVVCDDSNTKEVRLPSVRRLVDEKRRSTSLNEIDSLPRSFRIDQKKHSVSEPELSLVDPGELAKRAVKLTIGVEHPQSREAEELCSQEFAKMSPKKVQMPPPPQKKKNPILRRYKRGSQNEREEDIERPPGMLDNEYARSFQKLATADQEDLTKRSSTAIAVSGWMFTKVFESRDQAIEAQREAVREKEKTARIKNFFGLLAALFGGATTITTAVLAYLASTHQCDPCEVCDNIVNGTISS